MGQGFPIFRYPTYVVQTILPSEALVTDAVFYYL